VMVGGSLTPEDRKSKCVDGQYAAPGYRDRDAKFKAQRESSERWLTLEAT
jgi:hypothetical protein